MIVGVAESTVSLRDALAPYLRHDAVPAVGTTALLVIDMQEHFGDISESVAPNVAELVAAARLAGMPVVFTRHGHHDLATDGGRLAQWWDGDLAMVGTPAWQLLRALTPQDDDVVIDKERYSAFYGTVLDDVLRGEGITDLIICGVMTNCCCETTARDAFMRDYRVFVVADATATADSHLHVASLTGMAYSCAIIKWTDAIVAEITAVE
jgi:nicotinamidase-related amidase